MSADGNLWTPGSSSIGISILTGGGLEAINNANKIRTPINSIKSAYVFLSHRVNKLRMTHVCGPQGDDMVICERYNILCHCHPAGACRFGLSYPANSMKCKRAAQEIITIIERATVTTAIITYFWPRNHLLSGGGQSKRANGSSSVATQHEPFLLMKLDFPGGE